MSAADNLNGQQFPIYEVGDPAEYSNPRYHVTNYRPQDKVHPTHFGMPIREEDNDPVHVTQHDTKHVDVPVSKVWGTQDYVYKPHVENLAKVPQDVLEPPRATRWHDGTYSVDDHHRTAAAFLRGDKKIRLQVDTTAEKSS